MNSVDHVAKILKEEGVTWMSCYPSNPLIEAVAKEGIRRWHSAMSAVR